MVPYIDSCGRIHATSIAMWKCNAYELYGSIVSTVYKRLVNKARKIRFKYRPNKDLLLKIAALYGLFNEDNWYNRVFAMMYTSNSKHLKSLVYKRIKQMDSNTRFLLDQVLQATLWFQHRVRLVRGGRREMSKPSVCPDNYHYYPFPVNEGFVDSKVIASTNRFLFQWVSVYTHPLDQQSRAVNSVQSLLALEDNLFSKRTRR